MLVLVWERSKPQECKLVCILEQLYPPQHFCDIWPLATGRALQGAQGKYGKLHCSELLWAGLGFPWCCLDLTANAHISRGPVEDNLWTSLQFLVPLPWFDKGFNHPCSFSETLYFTWVMREGDENLRGFGDWIMAKLQTNYLVHWSGQELQLHSCKCCNMRPWRAKGAVFLSWKTLRWFKQIPSEQAQTGKVHLRHHQPSPRELISYRNKTGQMKTWEGNGSWGIGSRCLETIKSSEVSQRKNNCFLLKIHFNFMARLEK